MLSLVELNIFVNKIESREQVAGNRKQRGQGTGNRGAGNREQGTVLKIPPLRENGDRPQKSFYFLYKININ